MNALATPSTPPVGGAPPVANDTQIELLKVIVENTASANSLWEPVWDAQGTLIDFRYVFVNPSAAQYLRKEADQLRGHLVSDEVYDFKASGQFALFADVFLTGRPLRRELLHPSLNRWLDISASRVGEHLLMSFYDTHEIHLATDRSQKQAELLQRVVDHAPSGMILLEAVRDETGNIVDFRYVLTNQMNAQLTGYTVEQMVGSVVSSLFPGYQSMPLFSTLVHVTNSGEAVENTFEYDRYGLNATFDGFYVRQGDGVLFTFNNVTRLREQQLQLEAMNRDLFHSNESLQQFAYIASHDLQEPLRKVQSFGQMLAEQYATQLDASGIDLLARMQGAAKRMSSLIHDLLNYARLTTEKETLMPVSLSRTVDEALIDLNLTIQVAQPTIEIDPLPVIHGRAIQLQQVFQNLLSNALKFQPPGQQPHIQVRCRPAHRPELPANLSPAKDYWRIDVQDNGIGFDQQHAERIFEVFQRLHGKNKFVGTGIGLAVCRRVAENHGGTMIAASQLGHGATFSLFLPTA